jgi:hypothetical protein
MRTGSFKKTNSSRLNSDDTLFFTLVDDPVFRGENILKGDLPQFLAVLLYKCHRFIFVKVASIEQIPGRA